MVTDLTWNTEMKLTPLIKITGGKRRLAPKIVDLFPKFNNYHEPMVGGGAVFCELYNRGLLNNKTSYLSDINVNIIKLYEDIKHNSTKLISKLLELTNEYGIYDTSGRQSLYYTERDKWNRGYKSSSRFVFLKQTAFNGLWRENSLGKFNVPWGKYKKPSLPTAAKIVTWDVALQNTVLSADTYLNHKNYELNDLVYFDPPYYGTFDKFNKDGFSTLDHELLIKKCRELNNNGVNVVYSNSHHEFILSMIEKEWINKSNSNVDLKIHVLNDRTSVSGHNKARNQVPEILITSYV